MKGDVSRRTFLAAKHYHSVQMQQGRVQLDADWNEQVDLAAHRVETETIDVVGTAGGPQAAAGFELTPISATDFTIGAGRYYVDGLLVVNDGAVAYTGQPDHPGRLALVSGQRYLVYLDVWERHVTFLDDPYLREVALGGPDTATRERTVWQVKVANTADLNCLDAWTSFFPPLPPSGKLQAKTATVVASDNPCLVRPSAGYRGLENQLYRVEIHTPGSALDLAPAPFITVTFNPATPRRIVAASGTWAVGSAVQITSTASPNAGPVYLIAAATGTTLDLNAEISGVTFDSTTRLRPVTGAVYKWSRDNGAIATRIKAIDPTHLKIEVDSLGPDDVLGFRDGDYVELADDRHDLGGSGPGSALPGEILQIKKVYPGTSTIELVAPSTFVLDTTRHPKLRKWNGLGAVAFGTDLELELGLQVRFTQAGAYRTADYWQIAARASNADGRSGNIEWPYADPDQLPFGIVHHFAPLGLIDLAVPLITDCRALFPPLTQLKRLCYVGGDGQEVMPDLTLDPNQLVALPHPLVVGVVNGLHKVVGAKIRFTIVEGDPGLTGDRIQAGAATANGLNGSVDTVTGADGTASCVWSLRGPRDLGRQVRAQLLNSTDDPEDVPPILFGANRSVARQVAFLPPAGCAGLSGTRTVQDALETLAHVRTLQAVGGDGQDALPGGVLTLPIEVEVRDHCGPIVGARIEFKVATGGLGAWPIDPTVSLPLNPLTDVTDANGRVRAFWRLAATTGTQEAIATLLDGPPVGLSVRFTANAVVATNCGEKIAHNADELRAIFAALPDGADAHICIAPGLYGFNETVEVVGKGHLKISGGGDASWLSGDRLETVLRFQKCASVTIRDLRIDTIAGPNLAHQGGALELRSCDRVTIEHLRVTTIGGRYRAASCIAVIGEPEVATSLRIRSCDLTAGDGQLGIMAINTRRAEIEDNTVRVAPFVGKFADKLKAERKLVNGRVTYGRYVDGVSKFIMHPTFLTLRVPQQPPLPESQPEQPPIPDPPRPPVVNGLYYTSLENRLSAAVQDAARAERILPYLERKGGPLINQDNSANGAGWQFQYETAVAMIGSLAQLLNANRVLPAGVPVTFTRVKEHLAAAIDLLVTRYLDGALPAGDAFRIGLDFLADDVRAVGHQGILVGGRVSGETRILDNTVSGFAMGIHVGHSAGSHHPRRSARTLISGNTVSVRINGEHWNDRHGIFSGNSTNTIIENNAITADKSVMALNMALEGIRAYGIFGPMLMIRANQMIDCEVGVRVRALNPASQNASVWRVVDNAVRGTLTPYDLTPPMP